jgi:D-beta-D-heptose 7-phosphate kinase/D-beta-D-heptose 1-phosphate adenosyltransferase
MHSEELKAIVSKFDNIRVLVIGDLMLDTFIRGDIVRISDEAPVPVLDVTSEIVRPGGAANAMSNITALEGTVTAAGVIGNDTAGKRLQQFFSKSGVNIEGVIVSDSRKTVEKTRIIAEKFQQNVLRIDKTNKTEIAPEETELLLEFIRKKIESVDAVLVSDYNGGIITKELLEKTIRFAKAKKKTIVVDSKRSQLLEYRNVAVVKVSVQIASEITGVDQINETSIRNIGQWMLTQLESDHVLITQGAKGMTLFGNNGSVTYIPSVSKEQGEVTGVADTVGAVLALSLGADQSKVLEAAVLANTAAGIKVGKIGSATVTRDELVQKLESLNGNTIIHTIAK